MWILIQIAILYIRELKKNIWNLFYVDNGAVISSDPNYLSWAHGQLSNIFGKYHFKVQQFVSNYETIQQSIAPLETQVPVKLLCTVWDVKRYTLCMEVIHLDLKAKTKRSILQSLVSNFDLFGLALPFLNRARIFMQKLQSQPKLGWDEDIPSNDVKEWTNISTQANNTPILSIKRFNGK